MDDEIIGTSPKLLNDFNWDNEEYLNHLPKKEETVVMIDDGIYDSVDHSGYMTISGNKLAYYPEGVYSWEGTYSISGDKISITANGNTAEGSFSKTNDGVIIEVREYKKASSIPDYSNSGSSVELSGKYEAPYDGSVCEFSGNKIVFTEKSGESLSGTYSISNGTIKIYFDNYDPEEYEFSQSGDIIIIGEKEYKKKSAGTDNGNSGNSPLYGVYMATDEDASFTFDGNTVIMNAAGIEMSGTYKIEGDKLKITFEYYGSKFDQEFSFRQSGDSIFIEGQEYKHTQGY